MSPRKWGKRIDIWELWKDNKPYKFELRMGQTSGYGYEAVFRSECEALDILIEDGNVTDLKKKSQKALDAVVLYTFEPKLFVTFHSGAENWYGRATQENFETFDITAKNASGVFDLVKLDGLLKLKIHRVLVAELPDKDRYGHLQRLQKTEHDGKPNDCRFRSGIDKNGECRVELEDNEVNREALQVLVNGMATLGDRLQALLNPAGIEKRLKAIAINGQKLLPEKTEG